ncbi:hybrid sensor histidine kinase/response regulator [Butyrivibrio sp. JL13D10]|uniref:hybrid sensor histidine kinase/response regulator n=1 Tax=Butyrivibrio sp. JL13D10 TaxID=3236815 RepID=UPI0038B5259E
MNRNSNERFIILIIALTCIVLSIESIMSGWEFWVPPIIIIGTLCLLLIYISGSIDFKIRKIAYMLYEMFALFYHGVHGSSLIDIPIAISFAMLVFSFFNESYMMHFFLGEYFFIMIIQFLIAIDSNSGIIETIGILRILLHTVIVCMMYVCCIKTINDRDEMILSEAEKDERIEAVDADMEDFLSNISHEFRTPVNVVNGMSEMLIKKNVGNEAYSIKKAGIRLAYQIEDIQDYTECKREKVILEEDDYMCTSLINDVVASFRYLNNDKKLEMIVDMEPSVPSMMCGDVKKLHKIFRHLLENAIKFTRKGGIYVKVSSEKTDYGVNLCLEMTDTGKGMDRWSIASVSKGMFQVNKKRNRSSGGIGLGLFIVYGFAHRMGGFVKIESEKHIGTTVRVTIPQKVVNMEPCLNLAKDFKGDILFHVRSDKYTVPKVRDFYRIMATNLAKGIRVPLYPAGTVREVERLLERLDVAVIFMGQEEYEENSSYFDELSKGDVVVAVSAGTDFKPSPGSAVIVMPKPLYAYPVIKILNEGRDVGDLTYIGQTDKPVFNDVKALIVDDEPMNLVVATELFKDYEIQSETALSGPEAISKYRNGDYDVVFMDHMMPGMDGVEAMKQIKQAASEMKRNTIVIALTANAVSGAREMFMQEGFDGFIAKPISIADFERVMAKELPRIGKGKGGQSV